jgi:DNA-binding CsgD family transcriptional regulator
VTDLEWPRKQADRLVGRDSELRSVESVLAAGADNGGALLLIGEAGVGKTALLDAAQEAAEASGTRVIRSAGVQFEADLSYAALNQLLLPLHEEIERLPKTARDALRVVCGIGDVSAPEPLAIAIANATVALLRAIEADGPVAVIVDDVSWLDRPSATALAFLARRVNGMRVAFFASSRPIGGSFFEHAGLPEHELRALDEDAAHELLRRRYPTLALRVRQRVVAEAEGNPLALLELPEMLSSPQRTSERPLPAVMPLSHRLESAFASRVNDLPAVTRELLLFAALEGTGSLGTLARGDGTAWQLDDLAPAERDRLIRVDDNTRRLKFRHPLIRSAVIESSSVDDRRRAHLALADLLVDKPERRAMHLAHATTEPDEDVAGLVEQAAVMMAARGDGVAAVAALTRAADLSPRRDDRSRRLGAAAFIGATATGDFQDVPKLLEQARAADPDFGGSLLAAAAAAYLIMTGDGDVDTAHRLLVSAIEHRAGDYRTDDEALSSALSVLGFVCYSGGRADLWEPYHTAVAQLEGEVPLDHYLTDRIWANPARASAQALQRLDEAIATIDESPEQRNLGTIAITALYADRIAGCREALWRIVRGPPGESAAAFGINARSLLGADALAAGRWDEVKRLTDEGLELCDAYASNNVSIRHTTFWYLQAMLAAAHGDDDATRSLTNRLTRWAAPRGIGVTVAMAHHALGLAAIGRGDFEEAYRATVAVSPPGELASHVAPALWVAFDLVEAASRTGRREEAAAHAAALEASNIAAISPRLALVARGSAALVAPDDRAATMFEKAISTPGAQQWPFELARVQLMYGEHLRRARRVPEARTQLTSARDCFERLGATPWSTRANHELRASGAVRRAHGDLATGTLTVQEREIASLAAAGLTNKEIAVQLLMSPRTVGAHLYRIFPKLGITSRAALRDALDQLSDNAS